MKYNKLLLAVSVFAVVGCSDHTIAPPDYAAAGAAVTPHSMKGNVISNAGPTTPVSGGSNMAGITVPTATAAVGRIQNGLEGNVMASSGNFAKAFKQVKTNLPDATNINNATGYDQIQLLVYAACSDLTTGGTPMMQSVYGIQPAASIATNQAALIAAGVRMLDKHVAGLASAGPDSAQINTIFTNLVQAQAAGGSNTSKMAFMAVCIAANSAGATLLGM